MSVPTRKRSNAEAHATVEELRRLRANYKKFNEAIFEVLEAAEMVGEYDSTDVASHILETWETTHKNRRMDDLVEFLGKPLDDKVKIREWTLDKIMIALNRARRGAQPKVEKVGGWRTIASLQEAVEKAETSDDSTVITALVQEYDDRCIALYNQAMGILANARRLRTTREALAQRIQASGRLYLQTPLLLAAADEAFCEVARQIESESEERDDNADE